MRPHYRGPRLVKLTTMDHTVYYKNCAKIQSCIVHDSIVRFSCQILEHKVENLGLPLNFHRKIQNFQYFGEKLAKFVSKIVAQKLRTMLKKMILHKIMISNSCALKILRSPTELSEYFESYVHLKIGSNWNIWSKCYFCVLTVFVLGHDCSLTGNKSDVKLHFLTVHFIMRRHCI